MKESFYIKITGSQNIGITPFYISNYIYDNIEKYVYMNVL